MPEFETCSTDILERAYYLGLRVVTYTNQISQGERRKCWIPRDCIGTDGKAGIFHRLSENGRRDVPGANYGFDGWEPWADGPSGQMHGGRYPNFESALAWMEHFAPHRIKPESAR